MQRYLSVVIIVAACGGSPNRAAPTGVPVTAQLPSAARLLEDVPFQQWPTLPSTAIGLLVEVMSPWGPTVLWSRSLRVPGDLHGPTEHCYLFFIDGRSAQAPYFPSTAGGAHEMKNWGVPVPDGGTTPGMNVSMMCPLVRNTLGLSKGAHLVRLEINGGAGAPPTIHFIATKTTVLDGTPTHPIVPSRALGEARARFDTFVRERSEQVADMIVRPPGPEHRDDSKPPFGSPHNVADEEGVFPSWDEAKGELSVLFIKQRSTFRTRSYPQRITHCCTPPRDGITSDKLETRVRIGYFAIYDRHGKRTSEQFLGPSYEDAVPLQQAR